MVVALAGCKGGGGALPVCLSLHALYVCVSVVPTGLNCAAIKAGVMLHPCAWQ